MAGPGSSTIGNFCRNSPPVSYVGSGQHLRAKRTFKEGLARPSLIQRKGSESPLSGMLTSSDIAFDPTLGSAIDCASRAGQNS